ncbi:MAG: CBS domain-containing protein [Desulfuromonadales bacterium]|uniref:CBS domain-containing protein n=1 Tax=Desulfuromonas sp. KJ2020 TaxID=2919173 RepID=UPI000323FF48|nr:CBS domain-containing protein [Desulfuromonas sp. KJ2020]MCP3177170.1 CBS domain-containing protein [Desulfuromonas sp. KJ2020]
MLHAKDIMTTKVHTVTPATTVDDLARLFVETGVNAMPVVDEEGVLLGLVTQTDLVEQDRPLHIPTVISIFDWVLYLESEKDFREEVQKITARTVGEIYTPDVEACTPETSVPEIASVMTEKKVHLLPVVDEGKLVGVVARLDVIRSMGR